MSNKLQVLLTLCLAVGVINAEAQSWTNFSEKDGLISKEVLSISQDNQGNIWVGTKKGVSKYDGKSWINYKGKDEAPRTQITSIMCNSSGSMLFGTLKNGAYKFNGSEWYYISTPLIGGIESLSIKTMMEDSHGNIWFGTRRGVGKFDGTNWTVYTKKNGLAGNCVYSIEEADNGDIWFGTFAGRFSKFDGTNWERHKQGGVYWNGGAFFAAWIWLGIIPAIPFGFIPPKDSRTAVVQDDKGNIWMCTNAKGVFKYDGTNTTHYSTKEGLAHNRVNTATKDSKGNLWFATANGLSKYDGSNWTSYRRNDGLANNRINAVMEDKEGNVWIGTSQGLTMYKP